jgi:hypothetical protein
MVYDLKEAGNTALDTKFRRRIDGPAATFGQMG